MNEYIENKSKRDSAIITAIVSIAMLLLLLITFSFDTPKEEKPVIEIALNISASNYGTTETGSGIEEPSPQESAAESQQTTASESAPKTPIKEAVTQKSTESRPVSSPKATKKKNTKKTTESSTKKAQPKGDAKGKNALDNLLGGKGNSNSGGQGNNNSAGNVGDPSGTSSYGGKIGEEEWKSKIPNATHQCDASGTVVVNITVNASGAIKSARAGSSPDACLSSRAITLVKKHVTAYPGNDGRTGTYRVNFK